MHLGEMDKIFFKDDIYSVLITCENSLLVCRTKGYKSMLLFYVSLVELSFTIMISRTGHSCVIINRDNLEDNLCNCMQGQLLKCCFILVQLSP